MNGTATFHSYGASSQRRTETKAASGQAPIDSLYVFAVTYRHSIGGHLSDRINLRQGTLDLLILKSLSLEEMHGLGISRRIEQMTGGSFHVKPGSLFPALHRLEQAGWLVSAWGESENQRKAKYYALTKAGRKQLRAETVEWNRISGAMNQALQTS